MSCHNRLFFPRQQINDDRPLPGIIITFPPVNRELSLSTVLVYTLLPHQQINNISIDSRRGIQPRFPVSREIMNAGLIDSYPGLLPSTASSRRRLATQPHTNQPVSVQTHCNSKLLLDNECDRLLNCGNENIPSCQTVIVTITSVISSLLTPPRA